MSKKKEFPKVGVDATTLPDNDTDSPESNWWPTRGKEAPRHDSSERKPTLTEEMERFRPVPVVGRLPWRTQYIVFSVLLLIGLAGLVGLALQSKPAPNAFQQHFVVLSGEVAAAAAGKGVPQHYPAVFKAVDQASAQLPSSAQQVWKDNAQRLSGLPQSATVAATVLPSAKTVQQNLSQAIIAAAPLWRQAGEGGEWTSVEAVNFAQVLSEVQYLQDAATRIANGQGDIPDRVATARQNIEQAFRVYAASPAATQATPLSQAWRALAAGFAPSRAHIDVLIGARQQWNAVHDSVQAISTIQQAVSAVPPAAAPASSKAIVLCALLLVVSGAFLIWIGWKQQRWRVLEAKSSGETLRLGVDEMSSRLRNLSKGDLTVRVRPSTQILAPLANMVNSTIKNLHTLAVDVKQTASNTASAAQRATSATGALVDNSRSYVQSLSENGEDVLMLSATIQSVSDLSDEAQTVSVRASETLEVGKKAVSHSHTHTAAIKDETDEGTTRAQRLQTSASEVLLVSSFLNEVSEQISVLAIQAAIQASKAGDSGQSFRVVADGLKALAEKSGESARRVASLVEGTVHDIRSMEEVMKSVSHKAEEASRLSDVSEEAILKAAQTLEQLQEFVLQIKSLANQQEKSAEQLATRTRVSLKQVEETSQKAQDAAEAVMLLVQHSAQLDQSTHKFKVKE